MLIHGQRETQRVINIIIAGNGLTLTQPARLPQNLSVQTGREKGGLGGRIDDIEKGGKDGRMNR